MGALQYLLCIVVIFVFTNNNEWTCSAHLSRNLYLHVETNSVRARERWRVRQTVFAMNVFKKGCAIDVIQYIYIARFKQFI